MTLQCPPPIWVNTDEQLLAASQNWNSAKILTVDTEFMRTDTFYPYLGLIQVSDGQHCWLIDPLADMDLTPVKTMLIKPDQLKVFHACSEDLEILQLTFEVLPSPMVDTQLGAAMIGLGFNRGYNALLAEALQLQMDKGETRSNWLQRPLTDSQCRYAAEDVYYLYYLYQVIASKLDEQGRSSWLSTESASLLEKAANPVTPANYYRKIKGAWKLDSAQLSVLQGLCEWRELEARKRNQPRNRIVKDRDLLTVAKTLPGSHKILADNTELHPGQLRRFGPHLLDIVQQGDSGNSLEPLPEPLAKDARDFVKSLKHCISQQAEQQDIAQELLATKQDVEQLVRYCLYNVGRYPQRLRTGWRAELLDDSLQQVITRFNSAE